MSLGLCLAPAHGGWSADRSADEIFKELDATRLPEFDKIKAKNDPRYQSEFAAERDRAMQRRAALILELYRAAPDHEKIPALMYERWFNLIATRNRSGLEKELSVILARTTNTRLKVEAAFGRAELEFAERGKTRAFDLRVIERAIKLAPSDERSARYLLGAAKSVLDERTRARLLSRLMKEYPDSAAAATSLGAQRRESGIGKPFSLEFNDAITGARVSTDNLRGKVVVLDFWASWCSPCIDELPRLKELYAKYRGQGVEFIGVSLDYPVDRGGLEELKKCVAEHGVPWPQYFQGNAFEGEFSRSWGVTVAPTHFVIDPAGNLYSTDARGKLDVMIPELIEAREQGQFVSRPGQRSRLKKSR
jgi:thiol-disulfide isomerase/thioredoxin